MQAVVIMYCQCPTFCVW